MKEWQERRANILQTACNSIAEQIQNGIRVGRAIKIAARRFRNRSLGSGRRIRLSEKTLARMWYAWQSTRDDAALLLRYRPGHPRVKIDPRVLRSITSESISTGRPVTELVRSRRSLARSVSVRTVYRRLPMRKIVRLARLQRRALQQQAKIERERSGIVASLTR